MARREKGRGEDRIRRIRLIFPPSKARERSEHSKVRESRGVAPVPNSISYLPFDVYYCSLPFSDYSPPISDYYWSTVWDSPVDLAPVMEFMVVGWKDVTIKCFFRAIEKSLKSTKGTSFFSGPLPDVLCTKSELGSSGSECSSRSGVGIVVGGS